MRWVTYRSGTGQPRPGVLIGEQVHGLRGEARLLDLLGDDGSRLSDAAESAVSDPMEVLALQSVTLLAPIPVPPSVRDFMVFEEHVRNCRGGAPLEPSFYDAPVFYFSNPAAVLGPTDEVPVSPGSRGFDYELEMGAVIGRAGHDLDPDEAEGHVAGYLIFCDWSARDLQGAEMRHGLGPAKGKDGATTLGPMLVTPDELAPRRTGSGFDLRARVTVNGRTYTDAVLSDPLWSFADMITYASRGTWVRPGDVIGSGTVGTGCILELSTLHGTDQYPWLVPGDEVRLSIEMLGEILARITPGEAVRPLRRACPGTGVGPGAQGGDSR